MGDAVVDKAVDNLSDFEMTKLCAEAMGFEHRGSALNPDGEVPILVVSSSGLMRYDPLHDDVQLMALVKEFPRECIEAMSQELSEFLGLFFVLHKEKRGFDLNRAVVRRISLARAGVL